MYLKLMGLVKGQSAIEYLTTYGWMLLVVAIVGGSVFNIVQNSTQISTDGFAQQNVEFVQSGFTSDGFQAELRNQESDQIEIKQITLSSVSTGETTTIAPSKAVSVGDTAVVEPIGLVETNTRNTIDVEVVYDTGGLTGLVSKGSLTGALGIDTERAAPSEGEWEFVDVSEVPEKTLDTSKMSDFYVMKYEASRKGNATSGNDYKPVSKKNHVPWASISQEKAIEVCNDAGYKLATNKQWQATTMAEIGNASTQPLGNTYQGEDVNGDRGTLDPTAPSWINRTLTGSGPESWSNTIGVYDLNGNVWEWTSTVADTTDPFSFAGTNAHVNAWSDKGYPTSLGSANSSFGGDYYLSYDNDNRVVNRGGKSGSSSKSGGENAGVFMMSVRSTTTSSWADIGFRCVKE